MRALSGSSTVCRNPCCSTCCGHPKVLAWETFDVEQSIGQWRDMGGSELANTQSFINGLRRLTGVEPPLGNRTGDA